MKLRRYHPDDLEEVIQLFKDTICSVNKKDYSPDQVAVWAERAQFLQNKNEFFMSLYTIVAVEEKKIIGYGNIDDTGYLDHLFVHKDFQRKKTATVICEELERYAWRAGQKKVTVHASITARPFFLKRGYTEKKEQQVEIKGIKLTNYLMEKPLLQLSILL